MPWGVTLPSHFNKKAAFDFFSGCVSATWRQKTTASGKHDRLVVRPGRAKRNLSKKCPAHAGPRSETPRFHKRERGSEDLNNKVGGVGRVSARLTFPASQSCGA